MNTPVLPYLVEATELSARLGQPELHILFLGSYEHYLQGHIAGAVWMDIAKLNFGEKPVSGLLPTADSLVQAFQQAGLNQQHHVVCYDEQAGTKAARAMWVLEAMGHKPLSFLNGGLEAWNAAELPLETTEIMPTTGNWTAHPDPSVVADKAYVLASLARNDSVILDARTDEEFQGLKSASPRSGRIPGARHLNWLDTIDNDNQHRLKSAGTLRSILTERGIDPDHEIIAHCQTHQRSSHSFVMLRSLGYQNVRGYPGAWSEWAADADSPIES